MKTLPSYIFFLMISLSALLITSCTYEQEKKEIERAGHITGDTLDAAADGAEKSLSKTSTPSSQALDDTTKK